MRHLIFYILTILLFINPTYSTKQESKQIAGQWSEAELVFHSASAYENPELTNGNPYLAKPGELYIVYLPEGGSLKISGLPATGTLKGLDPQKGEFVSEGTLNGSGTFESPELAPYVLMCKNNKHTIC